MARITIPIQASLNTATWEGAVNTPEAITFWKNSQVPFRGALRNEGHIQFETGPNGILIGKDVLTVSPANDILVNGQQTASYASDLFATDPVPVRYNDIHVHYYRKAIEAVRVSGTAAQWSELEISPDGKLTETEGPATAIANIAGVRSVKIIENASNELLVIGDDMFAINQVTYNFPIPSRGIKCCKVGTYYYLTIEAQGTWRFPDGLASAEMAGQTCREDGIYLTAMGSPSIAHFRIDPGGDGSTFEAVGWDAPFSGDAIYSQTYHPLEPFTVTRNDADPEDIIYRWVALSNSRFLQTDKARPTTDFNRSADGLSSDVTGQFNRAYLDDLLGVVYQAGVPIAVSVNGVLVTPVGISFDDFSYCKISANDYIVAIDSNLMRISRDVPLKIRQFSDFGLKINVANPYNIIDLRRGSSVLGSLDWNNRVKPEQVLAISALPVPPQSLQIVAFNSAIGANYEVTGDIGTSILIGSSQLSSASPGWQVIISWEQAAWPEVMNQRLIDYYHSRGGVITAPEYANTGFQFRKTELIGLRYVEPAQPLVPAPINASYQITNPEQTYIDWADRYHNVGLLFANNPIDLYLIASMFNRAGVVFTISSQPYFFDGSIYAMNYEDRMLNSLEFIVNTDNMRFLGNDSTQAYFISQDNYIWSFTGSLALSVAYDMTRFGTYVRSSYNQNTDELAVQFTDTIICIRKGMIRESIANKYNIRRIGSSVYGNAFYNEAHAHIYGPEFDEDLQPYFIQTAFVGFNEADITNYNRVWFRLTRPCHFWAKADVFNDVLVEGAWKEFLKASEGQIIPKQVKGRGIRISIRSDDPVSLAHLEVDMDKVGEVAAVTRVSK